ncbi:MAG: AAA family ATPase [candidate division WOR-3 bacterium]|nr:MAG: AAA family ATPase [candidate division WOR-3 bacterium]
MNRAEPTIQGRVREMMRTAIYGRGVKRVRMLQTHTSWVFLTGRYAYKVKKPVNFGFLDYTALSSRKFFCQEELRLNRRLSPDIYLEVLPIVGQAERLRLGGRGKVVDYALKMRELPQESIMTVRLQKAGVTFQHIDELARVIAEFHAHAERGREVARYGSSETIRLNWDENFAQTMEFRGRTIAYQAFDDIKARVESFIKDKRPVFAQRREAGFVRKCHGDLHSKNIFVGEKVQVFDCIEFNPRLSCSDVASEIAFMAMDLEYYGRKDLADYFVERYIENSGDSGLLRLLDFYKCYRAYVRGKVTSFNLIDPGMSAADKAGARASARRYFSLAWKYARKLGQKPKLIVVFGLPGTGKTYLAQKLAARLDAFHLMTDSIRKQLMGLPLWTRQFSGYDKGIYAPSVSSKVYREMMRRGREFLKAGQTVILDATFLREDSRARVAEMAGRLKAPVLFVQAHCPEKTVASRMRRRKREQTFSDADLAVYRRMKRRFAPPPASRNLVRVDTRLPVAQSLAKIERALLRL